jgi:hypothetical protein
MEQLVLKIIETFPQREYNSSIIKLQRKENLILLTITI